MKEELVQYYHAINPKAVAAFEEISGRRFRLNTVLIVVIAAILALLWHSCSRSESHPSHCPETTFDYFSLPEFYAPYYHNTRVVYIDRYAIPENIIYSYYVE